MENDVGAGWSPGVGGAMVAEASSGSQLLHIMQGGLARYLWDVNKRIGCHGRDVPFLASSLVNASPCSSSSFFPPVAAAGDGLPASPVVTADTVVLLAPPAPVDVAPPPAPRGVSVPVCTFPSAVQVVTITPVTWAFPFSPRVVLVSGLSPGPDLSSSSLPSPLAVPESPPESLCQCLAKSSCAALSAAPSGRLDGAGTGTGTGAGL